MFIFIKELMRHPLEQIWKSAQTTEEKETNTSKNADVLIVSEVYLKILNLSFKVKCLSYGCKILETTKKMISEMEIKMNDLYENFLITPMEIKFDDVLALAVAYLNLSRIYMCKENINLNVAKSHLVRCMELLKGKEMHYKVILIAIQVCLNLNIVWMRLKQIENCYPLLDKALELYLNYTKEEEYPDPFNIDVLLYTKNKIVVNSKIFLIKLHIITLKHMDSLYYFQPGNMHKFVIYIHNLLNKQLKTVENSTKIDMFLYWTTVSADLSMYFLHHDRFMEAKIHLAAADYMATMYYVLIATNLDYSESCENIEKYKLVHSRIIKLWAIYGITLLQSSKEKLQSKSCEESNAESRPKSKEELITPLTFVDLEKDLENITRYHITHTYVSNLNNAKIIFANVLKWLHIINIRYAEKNLIKCQVQTILYISKAYQYYAYFEESKNKRLKIIRQQIVILENFISTLSSKYNTLLGYQCYKKLYLELAIIYSTLLNMSESNEIEEITDEIMENKQLMEKINYNFNLFVNVPFL